MDDLQILAGIIIGIILGVVGWFKNSQNRMMILANTADLHTIARAMNISIVEQNNQNPISETKEEPKVEAS